MKFTGVRDLCWLKSYQMEKKILNTVRGILTLSYIRVELHHLFLRVIFLKGLSEYTAVLVGTALPVCEVSLLSRYSRVWEEKILSYILNTRFPHWSGLQ